MDDIVGIDLGTTNSLIGILEAGFPILLPARKAIVSHHRSCTFLRTVSLWSEVRRSA